LNVFDRDGSGACLGWKCSSPGKTVCTNNDQCGSVQ
jgi:hypothetical protein